MSDLSLRPERTVNIATISSLKPVLAMLPERIFSFNLPKRFGIAALLSLFFCATTLGFWVSKTIESGFAEATAASSGAYIEQYIAPHLQELATSDTLSPANVDALNRALDRPAARLHIAAIKIWKRDGLVIYSTNQDIIGRSFPVSQSLQRAWNGVSTAEFDDINQKEDPTDVSPDIPLLEVYTPIRDRSSGEIIAVLEFYEYAETLKSQLAAVEWHTWIIAALITIGMVSALFWIVLVGSKSIDRQRVALTHRISQLTTMLRQTEAERTRANRALKIAPEQNTHSMPRVASGLHDGPAQLIASAMVRLDSLAVGRKDVENLGAIRGALSVALAEIQGLCASLEIPEIQNMSLDEALLRVIHDYEKCTKESVEHSLPGEISPSIPEAVTSVLCRFVRESLAERNPESESAVRVIARRSADSIDVEVVLDGRQNDCSVVTNPHARLGLRSVWDRIECMGGKVSIGRASGMSTRMTASLPLVIGKSNGK
jgi:signal transduction histidine kinase